MAKAVVNTEALILAKLAEMSVKQVTRWLISAEPDEATEIVRAIRKQAVDAKDLARTLVANHDRLITDILPMVRDDLPAFDKINKQGRPAGSTNATAAETAETNEDAPEQGTPAVAESPADPTTTA